MINPALRIVADENIPLVQAAFGQLGDIHLLPGRALGPKDVAAADVLLVRSVTQVNEALLGGSRVRFVGSATIGTDHIDSAFLAARGIAFAHAPASNADSVVEYVLAALFHLAVERNTSLRGRTLGIVGCGNIGGRLARRAPALGLRVLMNDPPLAGAAERIGESHDFVPLGRILEEADMVTVHVPLTLDGPFATYHLLDEAALRRMKPGAWLINTSRGAAVSNKALKAALLGGWPATAVLDVWEGEPMPDPALVRLAALATPHIAGYSYDGKVLGTLMLYRALTEYLGRPASWDAEQALAGTPEDRLNLEAPPPAAETPWLASIVRSMYALADDDARMRHLLDLPLSEGGAWFTDLRKHYPRRRTFSRHTLPEADLPAAYRVAVQVGLGIAWR